MCIVPYMKLIWCNGFPQIYAWLEEGVGSICHGYMCIVLYMKTYLVSWFSRDLCSIGGGGGGSICHGYMCIVLYMKHIWYYGFPDIYTWLVEGVGSICHGYMCIVLYMKHIWYYGFPDIYTWLVEGVGSICHGYIALYYILKLIWCNGFPEIHAQLEEGVGSICHRCMCIVLYIYETYVVEWFSRDLCLIRGGDGVNLPWVYVHCAIYIWNLFGVMVFQRSMLDWRRRVQICQ